MKIYYRLILSRKEANIRLPNNLETEGDYGEKGYVWQAFCLLPNAQGNYPVISGWVIGDEAVGIGIHKSVRLISTNMSHFVPHVMAKSGGDFVTHSPPHTSPYHTIAAHAKSYHF